MQKNMQKMCPNRRAFLKTTAGVATIGVAGAILGCDNAESKSTKSTQNLQNTQGDSMKDLTPQAQTHFKALFGDKTPTLAQSDPEFFSNYANFAFDEVITESTLEAKERLMIILASLVAIPALSEFETMLKAALKNGVKPEAIKEILYQATPYVGMGKVIDFINATNAIFKAHNIALPLESQGSTSRDTRFEKGLGVQRAIFGEAIDKGNAAAPADSKHFRRFLSSNCFGDYYTRGGLELPFRELLTFAYLISMGGADSQVKAHVQGNLNVGNDRARLIAVVTALLPYIGYPRSLNALSAIDTLTGV